MDKKGKDKDKEKDKKQEASFAPPLRLESAKSSARTAITSATPVQHEITTRTPVRQEVKATPPVQPTKTTDANRRELHASASPATGHGAKEKERH